MTPATLPDELDAILNLETTFENEGRAEAALEGARAGKLDGYDLGWKAGSSLSAELEFMHGAATTLLALSKKHPTSIPARALTYARDLIQKSQPSLAIRGNDSTLDMEMLTATLRSRFRRMLALSGLQTVKFESRKSKLADLSF